MQIFRKKYTSYTDEELIAFLAKGDKHAFDEIYSRYSKVMFYYFKRNLWNDVEKAEDFVHDLFAKIIQQPESFDLTRNFKTWFYSVAGNMCKNEYKKQEVRKNTNYTVDENYSIADQHTNVMNTVQDVQFMEAFNEHIQGLDEKHSEVFKLRHFEGLSIKEIAEIVKANEGTIKSRLFYATKFLAERLKNFQPILNQ